MKLPRNGCLVEDYCKFCDRYGVRTGKVKMFNPKRAAQLLAIERAAKAISEGSTVWVSPSRWDELKAALRGKKKGKKS